MDPSSTFIHIHPTGDKVIHSKNIFGICWLFHPQISQIVFRFIYFPILESQISYAELVYKSMARGLAFHDHSSWSDIYIWMVYAKAYDFCTSTPILNLEWDFRDLQLLTSWDNPQLLTDPRTKLFVELEAPTIGPRAQWSGRFLGIIGWDPSVCKSNRLHVDILRFFLYYIGVYSINSSKMIGNFPAVSNFNRLYLKLNRFIYN